MTKAVGRESTCRSLLQRRRRRQDCHHRAVVQDILYREKTKTKVLAYTRTLPLARMVMASKMVTGSATPLLSSPGLARWICIELPSLVDSGSHVVSLGYEGLTNEVCRPIGRC